MGVLLLDKKNLERMKKRTMLRIIYNTFTEKIPQELI
jgi:hypothetical protein